MPGMDGIGTNKLTDPTVLTLESEVATGPWKGKFAKIATMPPI